jgi:hypothetical protein
LVWKFVVPVSLPGMTQVTIAFGSAASSHFGESRKAYGCIQEIITLENVYCGGSSCKTMSNRDILITKMKKEM